MRSEYIREIDKYLPNKIVYIIKHKYFKYIMLLTIIQIFIYTIIFIIGFNKVDAICEYLNKVCEE
jgi:hypothetical protein